MHTARGQEGAGDGPPTPTVRRPSPEEGGGRLYGSVRSHRMACLSRRKGNPRSRRLRRRGHPLSSVRSQCTAFWDGGEPKTHRSPEETP